MTMLLGDIGYMGNEVLYRELVKIVNSHQHWKDEPYYIFIELKPNYLGPRMDDSPQKTKMVFLKNVKHIIHNKITVAQTKEILVRVLPFGMRQLGTACAKIDNKEGKFKWLWVLPPDTPIMQPVEFDGESEFVGKSAKGISLRFSRN